MKSILKFDKDGDALLTDTVVLDEIIVQSHVNLE